MRPPLFRSRRLPLLLGSTLLACHTDPAAGPELGLLELSVSTSGPLPSTAEFTVRVDDDPARPLSPAGALEVALEPGEHRVRLDGIPTACEVSGANPRTVSVVAGATAEVAYEVVCQAGGGTLRLSVVTEGISPDTNGYTILVDGGVRYFLTGTEATLEHLAPGDHLVGLGELADNCRAVGANPLRVEIRAGAVAEIAFAVACRRPELIAFERSAPGLSAIYLTYPDGGGLRYLTDGIKPFWSPDGSRVAYWVDGHIGVIDVDGGRPVTVTRDLPADFRARMLLVAQWSPDGNVFAFDVDASPNREGCCPVEIWLINADGSGLRRLVSDGQNASWSPDGRRLAFSSSRPGDEEIYTVAVDGTGLTRLTHRPGRDYLPAWSPDGTRIAYHAWFLGDPREYRVTAMRTDGTGTVDLTPGIQGWSPVWFGDGTRLGLVTNRGELATVNADGSGLTVHTGSLTSGASWSRDRSRVAFSVRYPLPVPLGEHDVQVVNLDGTGLRNLTNAADTTDWYPAWQP